jgi:dTMP kinase
MTPNTPILEGFFVIEGIDASGTTTQLQRIRRRCLHANHPCWTTSEPTPGPVGTLIRSVLAGDVRISPLSLALLFAADRNEHVNGPGGILEHLSRGELVVSDRYLFSSLAYQTLDCDFDTVLHLNGEFPLPEKLFYVDVPVDVAARRLAVRHQRDLFDEQRIQHRVAEHYERVLTHFADTGMDILRIDGTLEAAAVTAAIWNRLV